MTLLDHKLSYIFFNNKKVKNYPHKYEKNEKEKKWCKQSWVKSIETII